jgi:hypothetical protein
VNADAFARLLTDYCLEATAGQQVVVTSTTLAAPLLLALQRELLERGAWPLLRPSLPGQDEGFWSAVRDEQLDGFPSAERAEAEHVDAWLRIQADVNTNALAGVDPARFARAARGRAPLREFVLKRRWAITLWPTAASAQQAAMGTAAFEAFVERALFLDRDDPIAAWGELHEGLCLVLFLAGAQRIPRELYEAARIDGAGPFREFFTVTLPGLRAEVAVALTLTMVAALRNFDLVYITTSGGPGNATSVPAYEVYRRAFETGEVGSASAMGITLTAVIFALTMVVTRLVEGRSR